VHKKTEYQSEGKIVYFLNAYMLMSENFDIGKSVQLIKDNSILACYDTLLIIEILESK
jgi:hypothetical protein